MSTINEDTRIERRIRSKAHRRARSKVGLIWHVAVFAMANLAMFVIDERYSPTTSGCRSGHTGWGVGLLHFLAVFSGARMTEGR